VLKPRSAPRFHLFPGGPAPPLAAGPGPKKTPPTIPNQRQADPSAAVPCAVGDGFAGVSIFHWSPRFRFLGAAGSFFRCEFPWKSTNSDGLNSLRMDAAVLLPSFLDFPSATSLRSEFPREVRPLFSSSPIFLFIRDGRGLLDRRVYG